jgi:hypothetical protein
MKNFCRSVGRWLGRVFRVVRERALSPASDCRAIAWPVEFAELESRALRMERLRRKNESGLCVRASLPW